MVIKGPLIGDASGGTMFLNLGATVMFPIQLFKHIHMDVLVSCYKNTLLAVMFHISGCL